MHRLIRFNARVTVVEPVEDKFPLVLESGEVFIFDGIILACGIYHLDYGPKTNCLFFAQI